MIGKLSQILVFGGRAAAWATTGCSRTPYDMNLKMHSRKGLKSYDLGGVGLGIVVALDNKSSEIGHEVLPKHAVSTTKLNRSRPILVHSNTTQHGFYEKGVNEIDVGSSEDYTYVTKHHANKTTTRVYYDDGGEGGIVTHNNVGVFKRTPQTTPIIVEPEPSSYPTSHFLNSCHLCRMKLHGRDIYMYRDKAFCSNECRSRNIMMDVYNGSDSSMSVDLSNSPYTKGQMFSTGILAF